MSEQKPVRRPEKSAKPVAPTKPSAPPPRRRGRLKRWLLRGVVAVVLLLVLLVGAVFFGPGLFAGTIREQVIKIANQNLNGSLAMGSLQLSTRHGVDIMDLKLTDAAGQPVASVGMVKLHWSLLPALGGTVRVDEVRVERPAITVRRAADGTLNLAGLVKPAVPAESPDRQEPAATPADTGPLSLPVDLELTRMRVVQGSLRYVDEAAGVDLEVTGIDVRLQPVKLGGDLLLQEAVALTVACAVTQGGAGSFSVTLDVPSGADLNNPASVQFQAGVRVQGLDLAPAQAVLQQLGQDLERLAGLLDVDVQVQGDGTPRVQATVQAGLHGVAAAGPLVGPGEVALDQVSLRLAARADREADRAEVTEFHLSTPVSTVSATATVEHLSGDPQVQARLQAGADVAAFHKLLGLPLGLTQGMDLGGAITLETSVSGSPAQGLTAKLDLAGTDLAARGGPLAEQGEAGMGSLSLQCQIQAAVDPDQPLRAETVTDLKLAGLYARGGAFAEAPIEDESVTLLFDGVARADEASMGLDQVTVDLQSAAARVLVEKASVVLGRGAKVPRVTGGGMVLLDLDQLERIARAFLPPGLDLDGGLHAEFHTEPGEGDAVRLTAQVQGDDLSASGGPLGEAPLALEELVMDLDARLDVQAQDADLASLSLTIPGLALQAKGRVTGATGAVELQAESRASLSELASRFAAFLPPGLEVADGSLNQTWQAEGSLDEELSFRGEVKLQGLDLGGELLAGKAVREPEVAVVVQGQVREGGRLLAPSLQLTASDHTRLTASAVVRAGETLTIDEAGVDADLNLPLLLARYGDWVPLPEGMELTSGTVKLSASASGPVDHVLAKDVVLAVRDLDLSGGPVGDKPLRFEAVQVQAGEAEWTGGGKADGEAAGLQVRGLHVAADRLLDLQGEATVGLAGEAPLLAAGLAGRVDLDDLAARDLALVPENLATSGVADLRVTADGTPSDLHYQLELVATDGGVQWWSLPEQARALPPAVPGAAMGAGGASGEDPAAPAETPPAPVLVFQKPRSVPVQVRVDGRYSGAGLEAQTQVTLGSSEMAVQADLDPEFKQVRLSLASQAPVDLAQVKAWLPALADMPVAGTASLSAVEVVLPLGGDNVLAALEVTGEASLAGVRFDENRMDSTRAPFHLSGGRFDVQAQGDLNGGTLGLGASYDLMAEDLTWEADVQVDGVGVSREVLGLLKYASPMLAFVPDASGIESRFNLRTRLRQQGYTKTSVGGSFVELPNITAWEVGENTKPHLSISDVRIARSDLLVLIRLARTPNLEDLSALEVVALLVQLQQQQDLEPYTLEDLVQEFGIRDGWIYTDDLAVNGQGLSMRVNGRTSLGGELDWMLETRQWLNRIKEVREYPDIDTRVHLGGTVTHPRLELREMLERVSQEILRRKAEDEAKRAIDRGVDSLRRKLFRD